MNYRKLYEKYAKAELGHAIAAIIGGTISVATGIWRLKILRDDQKEARAVAPPGIPAGTRVTPRRDGQS